MTISWMKRIWSLNQTIKDIIPEQTFLEVVAPTALCGIQCLVTRDVISQISVVPRTHSHAPDGPNTQCDAPSGSVSQPTGQNLFFGRERTLLTHHFHFTTAPSYLVRNYLQHHRSPWTDRIHLKAESSGSCCWTRKQFPVIWTLWSPEREVKWKTRTFPTESSLPTTCNIHRPSCLKTKDVSWNFQRGKMK